MYGFNPFIQVFYFYEEKEKREIPTPAILVLIPLFRSFIFTSETKLLAFVWLCVVLIPLFRSFIFTGETGHYMYLKADHSFNPFIQVFYFYQKPFGNETFGFRLVSFNPFIQVFYFYTRQPFL